MQRLERDGVSLWHEEHGPALPGRSDWFATALPHATQPLRGDDGV